MDEVGLLEGFHALGFEEGNLLGQDEITFYDNNNLGG